MDNDIILVIVWLFVAVAVNSINMRAIVSEGSSLGLW